MCTCVRVCVSAGMHACTTDSNEPCLFYTFCCNYIISCRFMYNVTMLTDVDRHVCLLSGIDLRCWYNQWHLARCEDVAWPVTCVKCHVHPPFCYPCLRQNKTKHALLVFVCLFISLFGTVLRCTWRSWWFLCLCVWGEGGYFGVGRHLVMEEAVRFIFLYMMRYGDMSSSDRNVMWKERLRTKVRVVVVVLW